MSDALRQSLNTVTDRLARVIRSSERWVVGLRVGSLLLAGMAAAVLLADWGWPRVGAGFIVAAALGLGAWAIFLLRRVAERAASELLLARIAERLAPELGTGPSTAVDLALRLGEGEPPFSRELARQHIRDTGARLDGLDLVRRYRERERKNRQRALAAFAVATIACVLAWVALDAGRARLWALVADPTAARTSLVPLAADIKLTYRYPAYTKRGNRVVEASDGSITAVVGTEVELEATLDADLEGAALWVEDAQNPQGKELALELVGGRRVRGKLAILRDGRYAFEAHTSHGDRLRDRAHHEVRATLDATPEIVMDTPATDVELKDDLEIGITWHAKDDFGVTDVTLVVEHAGAKEPKRFALASAAETETRREGRYRWKVAELGLAPGEQARFFLEAVDTDTVSGPKRATSAVRKLVIFSARQRHAELLERQRQLMDEMIDLLATELTSPFPREAAADVTAPTQKQRDLVQSWERLETSLVDLVRALADDELTKPEIRAAFANVREHATTARTERQQALARVPSGAAAARRLVADRQASAIRQLERDAIYLDDLLALQRIDELKETAKDLLAAQRDLTSMLAEYRNTQDPALKAELERRIGELRQKMLDLLQKMASIKEGLPGDYRNLESASMLQMDDQLDRLEKMLAEGDLEKAAAELEQLANMVENMVSGIDRAEEEFGGERYDELRRDLQELAQELQQLESEQRALADRSEKLLKEYRKKAVETSGQSLDKLVERAREKTREAIQHLETLGGSQLYGEVDRQLESARQRFADLDSLLEQRDFAEARELAEQAKDQARSMAMSLGLRATNGVKEQRQRFADAQEEAQKASDRAKEIGELLDKLFPNPAEVMSPEQQRELARMSKKQRELEQKAGAAGQRMEQLSQEVPLFGGEPKESLEKARGEMGKGASALQGGKLPAGTKHQRRAADELGKLREALQKGAKGGKGSLPMPMGGAMPSSGSRDGNGQHNSQEEVEIPDADKNRAAPRFRKDLLEAAKQKAPEDYEDAVRKYYEELIR